MDSEELEDMFRAFGYDERDNIIYRHVPRASYEEAVADQAAVFAQDGNVFSAAVERRSVRAGSVTFVVDAPAGDPAGETPVGEPYTGQKSQKNTPDKGEAKN